MNHVRTDDSADDFRFKMIDANVSGDLVALLQDENSDLQWLSLNTITTLAKFGRLICYLRLCKN